MTPPRNLRASTPLLIDGHAVGNADINRRVVIRAYASCLAWKTIFHAGDNSCRPVELAPPSRSFLPSFILVEISFSLSLTRACYCCCFSFFASVLLFHIWFPASASLSPRAFVRFVSSMQGQTYTYIYTLTATCTRRELVYSSNEQIEASTISINTLQVYLSAAILIVLNSLTLILFTCLRRILINYLSLRFSLFVFVLYIFFYFLHGTACSLPLHLMFCTVLAAHSVEVSWDTRRGTNYPSTRERTTTRRTTDSPPNECAGTSDTVVAN